MSGWGRAKGERQRGQGEGLMSKGGPKFKELRVWQKGKDLAVYIYRISKKKFLSLRDRERMYRNIKSGMLSNSKLISARSKTFCP